MILYAVSKVTVRINPVFPAKYYIVERNGPESTKPLDLASFERFLGRSERTNKQVWGSGRLGLILLPKRTADEPILSRCRHSQASQVPVETPEEGYPEQSPVCSLFSFPCWPTIVTSCAPATKESPAGLARMVNLR
jgi:hypothetical protein